MDKWKDKVSKGLEKMGEMKDQAIEKGKEKMEQYQIKEKVGHWKVNHLRNTRVDKLFN
jgi:hypothetical protein